MPVKKQPAKTTFHKIQKSKGKNLKGMTRRLTRKPGLRRTKPY